MLTAMIVDDEPLSAERLHRLLSEYGEIGPCYSFLNPAEARAFMKENRVDIAFLDISMPGTDGLTLSAQLRAYNESLAIVFVTGFGNYAVRAFDVAALDYLMKPVSQARLAKTMGRLAAKHHDRLRSRAATDIEVRLFGGLQANCLQHGQTSVKWRSPKTEELFAFLVCRRVVSREEIVDTLWKEYDTAKALKNLNSTLYYIRQALGKDYTNKMIQSSKAAIRVVEPGFYCDLYEFERLIQRIRQASAYDAQLINQADRLYAGGLLAGKDYAWARGARDQLQQDYAEVLETAGRLCHRQGQTTKALAYYRRLLKLDGIREHIHHTVIRLQFELGNQDSALQQYRELERMLWHTNGMRPDPRITDYVRTMIG